MPIYIHYGDGNLYDKDKFKPIENIDYNNVEKIREGHTTKPKFGTGLWASDITSPLNWRTLCYLYNLRELQEIKDKNYFLFDFMPEANVIHITHPSDLEKIPHIKNVRDGEVNILFEEALEQGIDAIELHLELACMEDRKELQKCLRGWDCSCVLVLNPNSIENVFYNIEGLKNFNIEIF